MKKIFLVLMVFSMSVCVNAQNLKPKKDKPTKKYGFVNDADEWVVQPVWDDADKMKDGFAVIYKDKKRGLIDETGKVVFEPQFDDIDRFKNGFAEVELNKKRGIICKDGKILFTPQFDKIDDFDNGIAKVKDNKKYGLISDKGSIILAVEYNDIDGFKDGVAQIEKDKLKGLCNTSGKVIVEPAYNRIESFEKGVAAVQKDNMWGLISNTGKELFAPAFNDKLRFDSNGHAIAYKGGKAGIAKIDGNVAIEFDFEKIAFEEGVYIIGKTGDWRIYNASLKPISKAYSYMTSVSRIGGSDYIRADRVIVFKEGKWGFINSKGAEVIALKFDHIGTKGFQSGFCAVQVGEKWGYIKPDGSWFKEPQFDSAEDFVGLGGYSAAIVMKDGAKYSLKPNGELAELERAAPAPTPEPAAAATTATAVAASSATQTNSQPQYSAPAAPAVDESWLIGTWEVVEEFMGAGSVRQGNSCQFARFTFNSNHTGTMVERDAYSKKDSKTNSGSWALNGSKVKFSDINYSISGQSADKRTMKMHGILGTWWKVQKK
ncbi:MAG: WG repeat-containing protein [Bacteroidales bacterium]|nr:WG repeat-containing protein [Bacteroidales bacterium]